MTMFKTKEQIEEMAKESFSRISMMRKVWTFVDGFKDGYHQAQQDIKEAYSEGFEDYCYKEQIDDETHQFDIDEAKSLWQAAKFSSKAQIDTLKQRELG